jgi:hypothetical protein
VIAASQALDPRDSLGVVMFDENAIVPFPVQQKPSPEAVLAAISPIPPQGTTNVFAGMQAAQQALDQTNAAIKHIVLFTDGNTHGGDTVGLAQQLYSKGTTLSVVGEGLAQVPYLQQLAQAGGGRYFQVIDMKDLPQIFLQETVDVSTRFMIERQFTPQRVAASPILDGLDGVPPLYGYNGTTIKETATNVLADSDGTPVLAQWQYGLGRAVAWTSDAKGRWAKDWVGWPEFPRFAAQMVGWALPNAADGALAVDLHSGGGATTIDVAVRDRPGVRRDGLELRAAIVGADGAKRDIALAATGPGTYHASFATPPQGAYTVQVAGSQAGQPGGGPGIGRAGRAVLAGVPAWAEQPGPIGVAGVDQRRACARAAG